jgi:hypothetical protein
MKQKLTTYVFALPDHSWNAEKGCYEKGVHYITWPHDTYGEHTPVTSAEIEVEIPATFSYEELRLAELKAEQAKVNAEFTARITAIQGQINELLAIEG